MLVTALWQDELQKVIALELQSVISDSSNGSTFMGTDSSNISVIQLLQHNVHC